MAFIIFPTLCPHGSQARVEVTDTTLNFFLDQHINDVDILFLIIHGSLFIILMALFIINFFLVPPIYHSEKYPKITQFCSFTSAAIIILSELVFPIIANNIVSFIFLMDSSKLTMQSILAIVFSIFLSAFLLFFNSNTRLFGFSSVLICIILNYFPISTMVIFLGLCAIIYFYQE
jgi:hypothetical protein